MSPLEFVLSIFAICLVAVSPVGFALQRDRTYTLISAVVLIVLLVSFLLGKVE
jgi:uncharacterized membrane protein